MDHCQAVANAGGARDQRVRPRGDVRVLPLLELGVAMAAAVEEGGDQLPDRPVLLQFRCVSGLPVAPLLPRWLLRDGGLVIQRRL